jgi:sRNA-binding protein
LLRRETLTDPTVPAPKADRPGYQLILTDLRARYPQCFPPEGADPKLLKIGIHKDLAARGLPEGITAQDLRLFFHRYVN